MKPLSLSQFFTISFGWCWPPIGWWFQRYLSDVGVGSCDDDVFLMLMMRFLEQSQLSASYRQQESRIVGLREGIFSKILYKFKRSFAIKKKEKRIQ